MILFPYDLRLFFYLSLLRKTQYKCNGFNGNCIGFNGNYNGVYWYVMDSIGWMEKCLKHTTQRNFVMFYCKI